jgi:hypothetical protein
MYSVTHLIVCSQSYLSHLRKSLNIPQLSRLKRSVYLRWELRDDDSPLWSIPGGGTARPLWLSPGYGPRYISMPLAVFAITSN